MAEIGERSSSSIFGWKVKTTSQMLALGGLLWRYNALMEIAGDCVTLYFGQFHGMVDAAISSVQQKIRY